LVAGLVVVFLAAVLSVIVVGLVGYVAATHDDAWITDISHILPRGYQLTDGDRSQYYISNRHGIVIVPSNAYDGWYISSASVRPLEDSVAINVDNQNGDVSVLRFRISTIEQELKALDRYVPR
jgi:hypothetical protein